MKREFWRDPILWAVVAGAFVLRLAYNLALNPHNDPTLFLVSDEREYFAAAHTFAEGRGLSFYDTFIWVRPPLFVLMLGAIFRFFGTGYCAPLLLQSLLSAATLVAVAWLAYRVAGRLGARIAAALGALYLPFVIFAGLLLSETLFMFLFALSLAWLVLGGEALGAGSWRTALPWCALAGLMLGLAILTRSTALAFVPLAALWLLFAHHRASSSNTETTLTSSPTSRLLPPAVLVAACAAVLAPWMARNVSSYGGFFVDTTGGYNFWLASVGVRDEPRLQADLRVIPNQAERQQFAMSRAWENIAADPAAYVGKGVKESLDLWKPQFSAEERQVKGYTWGRIPAWHLFSLLLFDDILYLLILGSALFGLILSPPHPLKSLTLLWVLLWVAMSFVFFAVTRFRLPIMLALLPWAAVGLSLLFNGEGVGALRRLSRLGKGALAASLIAAIVIVIPAIEWGQYASGIARWGEQEGFRRGEVLLSDGKVDEAIVAYNSANTTVPDTRYALAAAYIRKGEISTALSYLPAVDTEERFEPAILRGEAARHRGNVDEARSFFNAREVQVAGDEALVWAWNHLSPPDTDEVELGSGLDVGYVRGFYGPERSENGQTYRWSGPRAEFRLSTNSKPGAVQWSGWRPESVAPAKIMLYQGDISSIVTEVRLLPTPDVTKTETGPLSAGMRFSVNSFVASGADPRLLGVQVFKAGKDE